MQNDELKKYCELILSNSWYAESHKVKSVCRSVATALLQRLEAEEAKPGDAEVAYARWWCTTFNPTHVPNAYEGWLAACDWMKSSTNAPVGVPEGHAIVRTEPLDSMVPDYAHAGFAKQIYRDMIALSPQPPNSDSHHRAVRQSRIEDRSDHMKEMIDIIVKNWISALMGSGDMKRRK